MPKLTILVMSQDHLDPGATHRVSHFLQELEKLPQMPSVMLLAEYNSDTTAAHELECAYSNLKYTRNILNLILHFEKTKKPLTERELNDSSLNLIIEDDNKARYKSVLQEINSGQYQIPGHPLYKLIAAYPNDFQKSQLYIALRDQYQKIPFSGFDYAADKIAQIQSKVTELEKKDDAMVLQTYFVSIEPDRLKNMVDNTMMQIAPLLKKGGIVVLYNMGPQHCHPFIYHLHARLTGQPKSSIEIEIIPMFLRTKTFSATNPRLKKAYEIAFTAPFSQYADFPLAHYQTDTVEMKAYYEKNPIRQMDCEQKPGDELNFVCHKFDKLMVSLIKVQEEKTSAIPAALFAVGSDVTFRQNVASTKVSAKQIDEYLLSLQPEARKELVNSVGKGTGMSALHRAAEILDLDKMNVLLKHGADKTKATNLEKTAFDIAKEKGADAVILDVLRVAVTSTNQMTKEGR